MSRNKSRGLLELLYVHNPFYLISTCLFVYGLKLLFRSGNSQVFFDEGSVAYMEPWGLMASLVGVTVLMSVTAILVVRLGKVWEDARSLVLIVLLMLFAISVSFDELITVLSDRDTSQKHLFTMFGVGFCFAVGVSQLLIRGLRVHLPISYRLPMFGFLLLFFFWPLLLLTEVTSLSKEYTRGLIIGFPTVASALTFCLIPAIRKGSAAVRENGTPWSWPLFPWTPFAFIGLAVVFRSYSLTMSFDPVMSTGHYWETIFGLYQLVPFALAILFVLLEIGLKEKLHGLTKGVLLFAPGLLLLAYPWLVPWSRLGTYSEFTMSFVDNVASPVFIAIIGLATLYGWAWYKGVRSAELGFCAMVALSSAIGPRAFGSRIWRFDPAGVTVWPLLVMAILFVMLGIRCRSSLRTFLGLLICTVVVWVAIPQATELIPWRTFIVMHFVGLGVIAIGGMFADDFAHELRQLGSALLFVLTLFGCWRLVYESVPLAGDISYCIGSFVLAVLLWKLLSEPAYLKVAVIEVGIASVGVFAYSGYLFAKASLVAGVKPLALAALCFIGAVLISVLKAGLSRRIRLSWLRRKRAFNG